MKRTWWLVRHGESVANAEGWLAGGSVDAALTEAGVRQAEALAASFRALPIAFVVSSTQSRARITARLATGREPAIAHPGLRERELGDWERATKAALKADQRWDRLLAWEDGPPGGESQLAVSRRVIAALQEIDRALPPGNIAVFSHGTALRSALGVLDDLDRATVGHSLLGNAEFVARDWSLHRSVA